MDSIITPLYRNTGTASIDIIHPHQLSILFAVLAAGALPNEYVQPTPLARQYHILSRAAFSLAPIKRERNVASVQALLLLMWFIRAADPKSHEERWILGGICVKVAQQVIIELFQL